MNSVDQVSPLKNILQNADTKSAPIYRSCYSSEIPILSIHIIFNSYLKYLFATIKCTELIRDQLKFMLRRNVYAMDWDVIIQFIEKCFTLFRVCNSTFLLVT